MKPLEVRSTGKPCGQQESGNTHGEFTGPGGGVGGQSNSHRHWGEAWDWAESGPDQGVLWVF